MRKGLFLFGVRKQQLLEVFCLSLLLCSCGGGGGTSSPPPAATITSVTVGSTGTTVLAGQTLVFTAAVQGTGNYSSAVTWAVNGIAGGNAQNGSINNGTYLAPAVVPSTNPVTVTATSVEDPSKSGTATAVVYTIAIAPTNPVVYYGQTQQFTATVAGFNNPIIQWSAVLGQISSTGLYTAPSQEAQPVQDTVSASVMGATGSVSTFVSLQPIPPQLISISPDKAVVGQTVTLKTEQLYNATQVFFSLPNGNSVTANFTAISPTQMTATVPVGTASGPVFVQYTPSVGGTASTNSVNFTRLPNLHIRAQNTELSSGETTQFNWSLLGGNTSNAIEWTADQGTISATGLYQAPAVSGEEFATITGCITSTKACDSVMVHVLPFRIDPPAPVTSLGGTVQLNAIQGGSLLSPTWSLPAADGEITSAGLFTAPTNASQAGYIPVAASFGGTTENGSVAVTGGFPGLVNRVWDYIDFNNPGNLGMVVESVAVNGNRAYCVDLGAPFAATLSYAAIDVYDISNPRQPVWLAAVDATSSFPLHIFTYGDYLFTVDSGYVTPVPSRISIYDIQNQIPVLNSVVSIPELAFSQVNNGIVYGLGQGAATGSTTVPVYTFDVRSGSVIQNEYDLPPPPGLIPNNFLAVTGIGNIIYASQSNPSGSAQGKALDAFDISTSPPTLASWVASGDAGFELQAVNQLLFADFDVYDFSSANPTLVGSFPLLNVQSVRGNQVLALGDYYNYVVIDVTNPTSPVVTQNVANVASENPFGFFNAAWAGNYFLTADSVGGFSVYDASVPGGPSDEAPNPLYQEDDAQFGQIFDQVIQPPTLYAVGPALAGAGNTGGLITFDISGSVPNPIGKLLYTNEVGLAIQVSGVNAFVGLTDSLKVIDVSSASNPTEVASLALPANALALSGNTLFVGTSDSRLVVVDVSNPAAPNQIGSVSITGLPNRMSVAGTLLFVADGAQGLLIFDVSQPKSPALLSQFSLSAPIWDVAPSGTTVLLAVDSLGLVLVDVSNPAQVKQLSQTVLPPFNPFPSPNSGVSVTLAASVAVQGGLAYVGTTTNDESASAAVTAYDFSQPTSPRLVALRLQIGNDISVITPSGSDLFLAANGIVVQYNNSLPRNSIELYEPPAALAQSFATQREHGPSGAYFRSKLNSSREANVQEQQPRRKGLAPTCLVRSLCP
ncbi:MAG: hypothetical protein WBQ46_16830 [Terriglobales bacterium]